MGAVAGVPTAPGFGLPGLTGVEQPRGPWDVVTTAHAPELPGDAVSFVALADGTLVVDEDIPDGSATPLADALEKELAAALRGRRRAPGGRGRSLARRSGQVLVTPAEPGDAERVDLARVGGEVTATVDGADASEARRRAGCSTCSRTSRGTRRSPPSGSTRRRGSRDAGHCETPGRRFPRSRTVRRLRRVAETLRIIPLGGLGEVGKNMTVFEVGDERIVLDAGLAFPRDEHFGVDLVLPDFSYLVGRPVRAIVLTHAHEDHVGGLPYVLREVDVAEVVGTRLTLALVKSKLDEHGLAAVTALTEAEPGRAPMELGPFRIELIRMAHSIPDSAAVVIETAAGRVLHTGDWKLDHTPVDGLKTDVGALAALGNRGVDLLLGDSTNAERPGMTGSERLVGEAFRQLIPLRTGGSSSRRLPPTSTACSRRPRWRSRTAARSRWWAARCART